MKKLRAILCLTFLLISVPSFAKGIVFFDGSWSDAVNKAKSDGKLIFVDVYTDWCGPCKVLAKEVFTKDSVGDFYNDNFINFKLNAEEGEGVDLSDEFSVAAYPTLLFVSVSEGSPEVVYRKVGGMGVKDFVEMGEGVLDPSREKSALMKMDERFKGGDRDIEFVEGYLKALKEAHIGTDETLSEYLVSLDKDELVSLRVLSMIKNYSSNAMKNSVKVAFDNYSLYSNLVGYDEIFCLLSEKCVGTYHRFYQEDNFQDNPMISYLKTSGFSDANKMVSRLELEHLYRSQKMKSLALKTLEYISEYKIVDSGQVSNLIGKSYRSVDDQELLEGLLNVVESALVNGSDVDLLCQAAVLSSKLKKNEEAIRMLKAYQDGVSKSLAGFDLARAYWDISRIYSSCGEVEKAVDVARMSLGLVDSEKYGFFIKPIEKFLNETSF